MKNPRTRESIKISDGGWCGCWAEVVRGCRDVLDQCIVTNRRYGQTLDGETGPAIYRLAERASWSQGLLKGELEETNKPEESALRHTSARSRGGGCRILAWLMGCGWDGPRGRSVTGRTATRTRVPCGWDGNLSTWHGQLSPWHG